MKDLKKISTAKEMQKWIEKLKNAKVILPAGEWDWWQCPDCYNCGYHTGYHDRTMLRTPIEINGDLATTLRDIAVELCSATYEMHLFTIWDKHKKKDKTFSKWLINTVESWQIVKAACLTIKEKGKT
jgi:hypothetical protein